MALSDKQAKALSAKLRYQHVRTRECNGVRIAYVEGWHVIAEANRIFGFENWDRQTQNPECVWQEKRGGQTVCFYTAKVRISVRTEGSVTIREGMGTGFGQAPLSETAHEMALKAAETDATKRALATFGNPFGLALYDRDQAHVTKPTPKHATTPKPGATPKPGTPLESGPSPKPGTPSLSPPKPLTVILSDQRAMEVADTVQLVEVTRGELAKMQTLDEAYAFWTANLATFTDTVQRDGGIDLPSLLKERLRQLSQPKTGLLFPKETRLRDKDHLAFVGRQPCLVCGRRPCHAHHLKFAQPRSMAMKVSDEYTVPLCAGHHDALHRAGDERGWWARHGIIDPLKFANRLWAASRSGQRESYDEAKTIEPQPHSEGQTNGAVPE